MPAWMKWAIALAVGFGVISVAYRFAPWLLTVFFILNCFVLVIVVLLQSGKAADLAGAFGGAGSQTAFGPRGAANVLSKATTWCAVMFMLCALAMVLRTDKAVEQSGSVLQKVGKPAPKPGPATIPAIPQPTHDSLPAGQQPATQPPASQAPATSQPAATPGESGSSAPAQPAPASSQPAPAPTKKP